MRQFASVALILVLGAMLMFGVGGCSSDSHPCREPGDCPPGLAKKGGMPPGQAKKYGRYDPDDSSVSVDVRVRD
jgi:hypothetical protein